MKELDEETALSIVFANTKRKKRSENLLMIAQCFDYLSKLYGSQRAVAEKTGLSTEMIREFLAVLKLPEEVQELVSNRQIDSIDTVKEISALKDPKTQIEAAKLFVNSLSKDVRDIKRLVKDANLPVEKAKATILDLKPKGLHVFIIDFDDEMYNAINAHAKSCKVTPPELVRKIVKDWLKQEARGKKE
ncbi:MAG TPA: hypothetical protein HA348_06545 [Thermoplasmata archaeon]|nr:hypothetical protein [Thermoplasmata archaeon]